MLRSLKTNTQLAFAGPVHPRATKRRTKRTRLRGITLLEVLVSVLITGAMIVPALTMLGSVAASYSRQANRDMARCLAHELMSEIETGEFADPDLEMRTFGPEYDEISFYYSYVRDAFDDVDDYYDINETPPAYSDGDLMSGLDDFTRSVEVVYVHPDNIGVTSSSATGLLRIRVTVSHPSIPDYVIEAFRSESGPGSTPYGASANYVRRVGMQLKIDGQPNTVQSGAEIRNEVPLTN